MFTPSRLSYQLAPMKHSIVLEVCDPINGRAFMILVAPTMKKQELKRTLERLFGKPVIGLLTAELVIVPLTILLEDVHCFENTSVFLITPDENSIEIVKQHAKSFSQGNYFGTYMDNE